MNKRLLSIILPFLAISSVSAIDCKDYIPVIGSNGAEYDNLCEIRKTGIVPVSYIKSSGFDISEKMKNDIKSAISSFSANKKIIDVHSVYIKLYKIVEKLHLKDLPASKKDVAIMHVAEELALKIDEHINKKAGIIIKANINDILKDKNLDGEIKVKSVRILTRETFSSISRILYRAKVKYENKGTKYEEIFNIYFNGDIGVYYRPQEGGYPDSHTEKKVSFSSSGAELAGTLSYPRQAGKFPAVLLIAGSGPNNRDVYSSRHRMFKVISDTLVKNGYAVLRYDKRGVEGSSGNSYPESTTEDYMQDARNGFDFLKAQKIVDTSKIGIIGHSEGGIIASKIVSETDDVKFLVLLATPGFSIKELIYNQKLADDNESGKKFLEASYKSILNKIVPILTAKITKDQAIEKIVQMENSMSFEEKMYFSVIKKKLPFGNYEDIASPWFRNFLSLDINEYLAKIDCPVLTLVGDKDANVLAEDNVEKIKNSLLKGGNDKFASSILSDTGHMFESTKTYNNAEYKNSSVTFSPEGLEKMVNWLEFYK